MSTGRVVARVVAGFILLFVLVALPALVVAYNAQSVATSRAFLGSITAETDLFEGILSQMAHDLARDVPGGYRIGPEALARLEAEDWERILKTVAPPERMRQWTEDALDAVERWAVGEPGVLETLVIPYDETVDRMVNDPDQTVLRTLVAAQPVCGAGEDPLPDDESLLPGCQPSGSDLEPFIQSLALAWGDRPDEAWARFWPNQPRVYGADISLSRLIYRESGMGRWQIRLGVGDLGWSLGLARGLLLLLIIGTGIASIGLIAVLGARNLPEALRWIGGPVALVGGVTLGWALVISVGAWIGPQWWIDGPEVSLALRASMNGLAREFSALMFSRLIAQGGVVALSGLALWGSSFLAPKGAAR